jgi:hypothetical protein
MPKSMLLDTREVICSVEEPKSNNKELLYLNLRMILSMPVVKFGLGIRVVPEALGL